MGEKNDNIDSARNLRVIEGRSPRAEARRAWMTSRRRQGAILVLTYVVAGVFGFAADLDSPWTLALIPSIGYIGSTWVLSVMQDRWINRYTEVAESRRVVDISRGTSTRNRR